MQEACVWLSWAGSISALSISTLCLTPRLEFFQLLFLCLFKPWCVSLKGCGMQHVFIIWSSYWIQIFSASQWQFCSFAWLRAVLIKISFVVSVLWRHRLAVFSQVSEELDFPCACQKLNMLWLSVDEDTLWAIVTSRVHSLGRWAPQNAATFLHITTFCLTWPHLLWLCHLVAFPALFADAVIWWTWLHIIINHSPASGIRPIDYITQ